jgi:ribosome-binding factor A
MRWCVSVWTDASEALAALEHAASFLRREVARRLELFRVPELHFEADIATELGGRMDQLLKRIKKGRPRE